MSGVRLAAVALPGRADPWPLLGFALDDDRRVRFANGALVFGVDTPGLVIESDLGLPADIDGVPICDGSVVDGIDHPNGALELDHVVVMTDSLERTSAAVESGLGLARRRVRETPTVRQAFHRFDDQGGTRGCIIEVVENARVEHTALWGLVVNVRDLDEMAAAAGDLLGDPKPAVQPGRRIATVRAAAGLDTAVAVMSTTRSD